MHSFQSGFHGVAAPPRLARSMAPTWWRKPSGCRAWLGVNQGSSFRETSAISWEVILKHLFGLHLSNVAPILRHLGPIRRYLRLYFAQNRGTWMTLCNQRRASRGASKSKCCHAVHQIHSLPGGWQLRGPSRAWRHAFAVEEGYPRTHSASDGLAGLFHSQLRPLAELVSSGLQQTWTCCIQPFGPWTEVSCAKNMFAFNNFLILYHPPKDLGPNFPKNRWISLVIDA